MSLLGTQKVWVKEQTILFKEALKQEKYMPRKKRD